MMYRKSFFSYLTLLLTLTSSTLLPMGSAPMAPANSANPTNPINPQFSPEELEAQKEFNDMLAALQEMPEEELQKFEKALETEVKQELEKMSPQERKEFEDKMAEFWIAQGIDPNTIPPLEEMFSTSANQQGEGVSLPFTQESTPADAYNIPQANTPAAVPAVTVQSEQEVADMLDALIARIDSLRTKTSSDAPEFKRLISWKEALDELAYFLKVINKPEHHERLATKDFSRLFKILNQLRDKLAVYEPQLLSEEAEYEIDDPYEILRISQTASDKAITEAYEKYIAEKNPETLRAQLEKEGLSEDDIEGHLKSAKLSLNTISEAYEKLSDPKLRAQIDRSLKAARLYRSTSETEAKKALDALLQQLSSAVYQQKVLTELEQFLQKYAPTELAAHKKMQEAEAKRKKEQQDAAKIQPAIGYAHYDQYYPQAQPSYNYQDQGRGYDGGGYYPDYHNGYQPEDRGGSEEPKKDKPKDAKGGGKDKKEEKEKDKKEKEAENKNQKEKKEKQKPTAEDDWNKAVKELTKELESAQKVINDQLAADKKAYDAKKKAHDEATIKRSGMAAPFDPYQPFTEEVADFIKHAEEIEAAAQKQRDEATSMSLKAIAMGTPREEQQKLLEERIKEIENEKIAEFLPLAESAKQIYDKAGQIFEKMNLNTLNKSLKSMAFTTEKAQEFGFRLPYGTTWKKLVDKHKDIFNLMGIYQSLTKQEEEQKLSAAQTVLKRTAQIEAEEEPSADQAEELKLNEQRLAQHRQELDTIKKRLSTFDAIMKNVEEMRNLISPARRESLGDGQRPPEEQMLTSQNQKLAEQKAQDETAVI